MYYAFAYLIEKEYTSCLGPGHQMQNLYSVGETGVERLLPTVESEEQMQ